MQRKPWELLNIVWKADGRRVKKDYAEIEVWGEEPETDGRLKSAITKVNKALYRVDCPLLMSKTRGVPWVELK